MKRYQQIAFMVDQIRIGREQENKHMIDHWEEKLNNIDLPYGGMVMTTFSDRTKLTINFFYEDTIMFVTAHADLVHGITVNCNPIFKLEFEEFLSSET